MAPTVCMSDKPIVATDAPCLRRKSWQDKDIIYRHSIGVKRLSIRNDWEANYHRAFLQGARVPGEQSERLRLIMKRRKGLLEIVAKTIALVRRNHILQKRVDALRLETQDFIQSVLKNKEKEEDSREKVSSTTDEVEMDNSRVNEEGKSRIKSKKRTTSTCVSSASDNGSSNGSH